MALKDWEKSKRVKKELKEIRWDNKKSAESFSVVNDGKTWRVWIHDVFGYEEELKKSGFKTKAQALVYAKRFMRKN